VIETKEGKAREGAARLRRAGVPEGVDLWPGIQEQAKGGGSAVRLPDRRAPCRPTWGGRYAVLAALFTVMTTGVYGYRACG